MEMNYKLPAQPSPYDERDLTSKDILYAEMEIPFEYEGIKPTIYDQGRTSMCGAFALAALKEVHELKERGERTRFSPGYLYGIRDGGYEGEGVYIKQILATLRKFGTCRFEDFPMIDTYENIKANLTPKVTDIAPYAVLNGIKNYFRIDKYKVEAIQTAIMNDGGVIVGVNVFNSFFYPVNGVIQNTKPGEQSYGGHIMMIYGWKVIDGRIYWITANSWGTGWGDQGVCYIPVDYLPIYEVYGATDRPLVLNDVYQIIMYIDDPNIRVIKNDKTEFVTMDVAPFIKDGRTMVPVSFIAKYMGLSTEWQAAYKCVVIKKE